MSNEIDHPLPFKQTTSRTDSSRPDLTQGRSAHRRQSYPRLSGPRTTSSGHLSLDLERDGLRTGFGSKLYRSDKRASSRGPTRYKLLSEQGRFIPEDPDPDVPQRVEQELDQLRDNRKKQHVRGVYLPSENNLITESNSRFPYRSTSYKVVESNTGKLNEASRHIIAQRNSLDADDPNNLERVKSYLLDEFNTPKESYLKNKSVNTELSTHKSLADQLTSVPKLVKTNGSLDRIPSVADGPPILENNGLFTLKNKDNHYVITSPRSYGDVQNAKFTSSVHKTRSTIYKEEASQTEERNAQRKPSDSQSDTDSVIRKIIIYEMVPKNSSLRSEMTESNVGYGEHYNRYKDNTSRSGKSITVEDSKYNIHKKDRSVSASRYQIPNSEKNSLMSDKPESIIQVVFKNNSDSVVQDGHAPSYRQRCSERCANTDTGSEASTNFTQMSRQRDNRFDDGYCDCPNRKSPLVKRFYRKLKSVRKCGKCGESSRDSSERVDQRRISDQPRRYSNIREQLREINRRANRSQNTNSEVDDEDIVYYIQQQSEGCHSGDQTMDYHQDKVQNRRVSDSFSDSDDSSQSPRITTNRLKSNLSFEDFNKSPTIWKSKRPNCKPRSQQHGKRSILVDELDKASHWHVDGINDDRYRRNMCEEMCDDRRHDETLNNLSRRQPYVHQTDYKAKYDVMVSQLNETRRQNSVDKESNLCHLPDYSDHQYDNHVTDQYDNHVTDHCDDTDESTLYIDIPDSSTCAESLNSSTVARKQRGAPSFKHKKCLAGCREKLTQNLDDERDKVRTPESMSPYKYVSVSPQMTKTPEARSPAETLKLINRIHENTCGMFKSTSSGKSDDKNKVSQRESLELDSQIDMKSFHEMTNQTTKATMASPKFELDRKAVHFQDQQFASHCSVTKDNVRSLSESPKENWNSPEYVTHENQAVSRLSGGKTCSTGNIPTRQSPTRKSPILNSKNSKSFSTAQNSPVELSNSPRFMRPQECKTPSSTSVRRQDCKTPSSTTDLRPCLKSPPRSSPGRHKPYITENRAVQRQSFISESNKRCGYCGVQPQEPDTSQQHQGGTNKTCHQGHEVTSETNHQHQRVTHDTSRQGQEGTNDSSHRNQGGTNDTSHQHQRVTHDTSHQGQGGTNDTSHQGQEVTNDSTHQQKEDNIATNAQMENFPLNINDQRQGIPHGTSYSSKRVSNDTNITSQKVSQNTSNPSPRVPKNPNYQSQFLQDTPYPSQSVPHNTNYQSPGIPNITNYPSPGIHNITNYPSPGIHNITNYPTQILSKDTNIPSLRVSNDYSSRKVSNNTEYLNLGDNKISPQVGNTFSSDCGTYALRSLKTDMSKAACEKVDQTSRLQAYIERSKQHLKKNLEAQLWGQQGDG